MKLYRYTAKHPHHPGPVLTYGRETVDLDVAIMAALTYATWVAWFKGSDSDRWQPTLFECETGGQEDGPWTEIPTDDPRILAFFDQPDADETERQIVSSLMTGGSGYGIGAASAEEALAQVAQYDGYRVQEIGVQADRPDMIDYPERHERDDYAMLMRDGEEG